MPRTQTVLYSWTLFPELTKVTVKKAKHMVLERLKVLNTRQHDVVELRYLVGLPWKEIAAQLGVSVPTVEKDWQAARAWLRSQLIQSTQTEQRRP